MCQPGDPTSAEPTSEESYKCSQCGRMFPTGDGTQAKCPTCGKVCTRETCQVVDASSQGY